MSSIAFGSSSVYSSSPYHVGEVEVRSGADGSVRGVFYTQQFNYLGESLVAVEDLDGDGNEDLVAGSQEPNSSPLVSHS